MGQRGVILAIAVAAIMNQTLWSAAIPRQQQRARKVFSRSEAVVPGVVVIKFRSGVSLQKGVIDVQSSAQFTQLMKLGVKSLARVFPGPPLLQKVQSAAEKVDLSRIYFAFIGANLDPRDVAPSLGTLPDVEYAEPKFLHYLYETPNDPQVTGQTNAFNRIRAFEGWTLAKGDSTVVIATVDGGTYWGHEDLAANLWINPAEDINHNGRFDPFPSSQGGDLNGLDDGANGFTDDVIGWNFNTKSGDPRGTTAENADHGTATASVFGARTNNGIGMAGSSWNCRLMPVCAAGSLDNSIAYGFEGIEYAAQNGASVINCSWGRTGSYSQFEQDVINAVAQAGALIVCSAGNGINNNTSGKSNDLIPDYPSGYRNIFPVGATGSTSDVRAAFSNYGSTVPVFAPGVTIIGATDGGTYNNSHSGTSFSSPMVAGLAGIVKSIHPGWAPEQIAAQIRVTADSIDGSNASIAGQLGHGRVNFARALSESHPGINIVSSTLLTTTGSPVFLPGDTVILSMTMKNVLFTSANNLSVTISSGDPTIQILQPTVALPALAPGEQAALQPLVVRIGSVSAAKDVVLKVSWSSNSNDRDAYAFRMTVFPSYPQWVLQHSPTSTGLFTVKALNRNVVWAAGGDGVGSSPVVIRTTDEGANWTLVTGNIRNEDLYCITSLDENRAWVGTGDGKIFATVDGGANWGEQTYPGIQSPFIDGVAFLDGNNGFALGDPASGSSRFVLLKTTNGGQSWSHLANEPVGQSGEAGWNNSFWWTDVDHGWFGTNMNRVWRTTDGGNNWSSAASGNADSYVLSFKDNSFGIVGHSNGAVSVSSDGGATWRPVSSPTPVSISGAAFIPNSNFAWISNDEVVYRSTDNGATWAGQSLYPFNGAIRHISFADTSFGWAVTSMGEVLLYRPLGTVSVPQEAAGSLPDAYELLQNYPNPFNPSTLISYRLPFSGRTTLKVYDILGRETTTLIDRYEQAGTHQVRLNAEGLSSGIYFYQLVAGTFSQTKKILVLK